MFTQRKTISLSRLAAAFLFVAAFVFPTIAQSNKGTIVGTVTDPNGAVLKDAKVTATNLATGISHEVMTSDDGTYTIPSLEPGNYSVKIEASGFQSANVEEVKLETNARQPVDVKLTVGGVGGDTVTVTAEAPLVESETSVRGDLITGRQVTDLPIPQRNFTLLAGLSPGVTRPAVGVLGGSGNFSNGSGSPQGNSTESTRFRESGGSVLVINGARPTNNNFSLDGVDNNEGQFGQIATYPPPDAIAEFKVETSVAQAESGRAGGGIISATYKSGGNDVHGTLYEFYQGRFASAVSGNVADQLERGARSVFVTNFVTHQYGGTVGGPVFLPRFGEGGKSYYNGRNRTFFFVSYEAQRNSTPAFGGGEFAFVNVPTARMRTGDFGELIQPGTSRTYNTINGPINAPRGTVFCPTGTPAPANDIRNCGVALSPAALNTLQAYPLPTEPGFENNFRRNRKEKYNRSGLGIRGDHRFSDTDSFFIVVNRDESVRVRDNNFPSGSSPTGNDLPSGFGAGEEFGDSRGIRLGETHTFSPTVINDFRFGVNRVEIGINNPGINGALGISPNVSANLGHRGVNVCGECEGVVLLGIEELLNGDRNGGQLEFIGDGGPFYFLSNNYNFANSLTWVKGSSTFKFGGDLRVRQNSNFDGGRAGGMKGNVQYGTGVGGFLAGNYSGIPIGPRDSGSGIANFLFGQSPAFITRGTPGGPYFQSNKEVAFFGQDDWKVSPNLTLNLGLRWDLFTQPTERFDRQSNYNPANDTLTRAGENAANGRDLVKSDKNNFQPVVGFAYSGLRDDKKLVIRGGYRMSYAVDIPGTPGILSVNPPGGANFTCNLQNYGTASCPQLPALFNFDTGYPFPAENITIQPGQSFAAPAGTSLIFLDPNIKNELFHQFNMTVQYEFSPNWLAEAAYVGNRGRNLLVVQNIGTTSGGGIPGSREVARTATVTAIRYIGESWYDGLQTKLEKRYSNGLSILSGYTWSRAVDNAPGAFCLGGTGPSACGFTNPLQPDLDKGTSDFDVPHRLTFASVWDIPFGRGRRYGKDMGSGLNALIGGWQFNNNVTIQSGPPFSITANGTRASLGSSLGSGCKSFEGQIFCPATTPVFANDPGGPKFGNSGRNIFRGSRQEFWDASLFKNIHVPAISEAFNMQLRVQAYNVLNHVNRFRPRGDLGDSLFGTDTAEQNRRQLEFSFKLLF
ncbi:MAG: TonB-dependent receptor [Rubrivivax sp.]|nr:TonB-dependent receptor [Pyrinomonadaceae bacterium]